MSSVVVCDNISINKITFKKGHETFQYKTSRDEQMISSLY